MRPHLPLSLVSTAHARALRLQTSPQRDLAMSAPGTGAAARRSWRTQVSLEPPPGKDALRSWRCLLRLFVGGAAADVYKGGP